MKCLSQSPNGKWAEMLKLVPYEGMHGRDSAPKILVCVGGTKSTLKCQLANKALIDWQATTVKKTGKKIELHMVPACYSESVTEDFFFNGR